MLTALLALTLALADRSAAQTPATAPPQRPLGLLKRPPPVRKLWSWSQ